MNLEGIWNQAFGPNFRLYIYVMVTISFMLTVTTENCNCICETSRLFLIQLILTVLWTEVLKKNIKTAFILNIIIICIALYKFKLTLSINKLAAYILIPYLIWVFFSAYLVGYALIFEQRIEAQVEKN